MFLDLTLFTGAKSPLKKELTGDGKISFRTRTRSRAIKEIGTQRDVLGMYYLGTLAVRIEYNIIREQRKRYYFHMQQTNTSLEQTREHTPSQKKSFKSSRLLAIFCALGLGGLYFLLPERLIITPRWVLLAVEAAIILPLLIASVIQKPLSQKMFRRLSLLLLGVITVALLIGVVLLITTLGTSKTKGENLLTTAASMYVFNVVVFSLWYWETDGGGPYKRHLKGHRAADFMFPQQVDGNSSSWIPLFFDYLFLAFTGSTALSPTDTYPLTPRAKLLMMIEAIIALMILTILAGRAINIL
jgi:hypothetical protein